MEIKPQKQTWDSVFANLPAEPPKEVVDLAEEIRGIWCAYGIEPGAAVLEAGSGTGFLSLYLRTCGYRADLLDLSAEVLSRSKASFASLPDRDEVKFIAGDLLDMASSVGQRAYDVVWNSGVMEHFSMSHLVAGLRQMAGASRRFVFFVVPNPQSLVYLAFRSKAIEKQQWNVGVEFLRHDYAGAIRDAGLTVAARGCCGKGWTRHSIAYLFDGAAAGKHFQGLLDGGLLPEREYTLKYYLCEVDAKVPAAPPRRPDSRAVIERTFYLDALGMANSTIGAMKNEHQAVLEQHVARAAELQARLDAASRALEQERQKADSMADEVDSQRQRVVEATSQLQQASAHAADLASRLEAMQTRQQAGEEQLRAVREELRAAQAATDELSAKAEQEKAALIKAQEGVRAAVEQVRARLEDIHFSSNHCIAIAEATNEAKAIRLAKTLQYARHNLLKGSLRSRYAAMKAICRRIFRKQPLNLPNPLFPILSELRTVAGVAEHQCYVLGAALEGRAVPEGAAAPLADRSMRSAMAARRALRTVRIVTPMFYDATGRKYLHGGSERYHVELARLAHELGYDVELYQIGTSDWQLDHPVGDRCIRVYGVACASIHDYFEFNSKYHERCRQEAALVVYSPFILAHPQCARNAVGISHGIFWDHSFYQTPQANADRWQHHVLAAIRSCRRIVSVDNNTINWARAVNYEVSDRFAYVPNFVDPEQFRRHERRSGERVRVLFPRRVCQERGSRMALALAEHLLEKYRHVDFDFVGTGDSEEEGRVQRLVRAHPERVRFYCLAPDEMHKAYAEADICIIPTRNSEGTSLSCLEAMASGNAVVTTNIGGLTDLVLNEHNGLLIAPSSEELIAAVDRLVDEPDLRSLLAENAVTTSKTFGIGTWRARWRRILRSLGLGDCVESSSTGRQTGTGTRTRGSAGRSSDTCPAEVPGPAGAPCPEAEARTTLFVHVCSPGLTWSRMRQRPQQLLVALQRTDRYETVFVSDEEGFAPYRDKGVLVVPRNHSLAVSPGTWLYLHNPKAVHHLDNYALLAGHPHSRILFDVLDDPMIHADFESGRLSASFQDDFDALLACADVVITSGETIRDKLAAARKDIALVPNGVFPEDFAADPRQTVRPADMPAGRPVIGFHGALYEWRADYALLERVAREFGDCHVVIIGDATPRETFASVLRNNPNLCHLGIKPHEQLKDYLAFFDVAIIPFLVNEVTNAMSTIKLFEYCAAGTPMVSTAFSEVVKYAGPGIHIANSHDQFIAMVRQTLDRGPDTQARQHLAGITNRSTWLARAESLVKCLRN